MDSFKKFIQKLKFSDLGTPFQVSQGEHSKPKVRKRFNLGTPFQVSQGEHSKPKKDVQEQLKIEDGKNAYEFFHDMPSLNPHIGPDDKIVQAKLEGHYNLYSNPHKHAIIKYTNGSYDLNTHLFEFRRQPTKAEIKFWEGATHYRMFTASEIGLNKKGLLKTVFKSINDGKS